MSRFDEFWEAWPGNGSPGFESYTRKKDRKKCQQYWAKQKLDERADEIIRNVEQRAKYDKGWRDSKGQFLSAPLVYLNNERWADGSFNDIRDTQKRAAPAQPKPNGDDRPMSRLARGGNRILFRVAYGTKRGPVPVGKDRMRRLVETKDQLVAKFEAMGRDEYEDAEFIDVVQTALERELEKA